ncbi:MAG: 3'(2'),5'-bisphosphate nucleotidase CysQ, partial [Desulfosalsimonas sp.]
MEASQYLTVAVKAAMEAGAAALEVYEQDFEVEEKQDHSPLTLADRRAHDIISARLSGTGIFLLSEEGREISYKERRQWQQLWIVDPLDGTKEFVKKNGEFTINIALVSGGRPVLGVVYVPVKDLLYFAARDLGAYRIEEARAAGSHADTARQLVSPTMKLPLPDSGNRIYTIMGSRSHASEELEAFVEQKRREHG